MKVIDAVTRLIDLAGRASDLALKAMFVLSVLASGWFVWNVSMNHFDDRSGGGVYISTFVFILYMGFGSVFFSALWEKLFDD